MKRTILIAAIAAASCSHQEREQASQPLPVEVSTPIVREVTLTREYPGNLQADATVAIVRLKSDVRGQRQRVLSFRNRGELVVTEQ